MALTLEQLYQNVLSRPSDPGGFEFWSNYMGPTIEQNEIDAFVARAREIENPSASYSPPQTPTLVAPPDYPIYGPSGPVQTPISNVPVVPPPPRPPIVVTPVPKTGPTTTTATTPTISPDVATGFTRAFARPTYKQTNFAAKYGPAPTLEQLYQRVLGRASDPRGREHYTEKFGATIDPDEIATFVAAAQDERPGAFYAGPNVPARPISYADTDLLTGAQSGTGGPSVLGRTYLPGGRYVDPTGISTLVSAPPVFSGTPINPVTGKPMVETPRPAANVEPPKATEGKKAGGLASIASHLEDKGRNGDTELVHMTKDEVAGLKSLAKSMGGQLTRNPYTGLYEASWLSDRLRDIRKSAEKVADTIGIGGVYRDISKGFKKIGDNPYVQNILTAIAGATYGPMGAGAVRTAFSLNDGQSTEKALRSGAKAAATTYVMQEITGLGAPGSQPPAPVFEGGASAAIPVPGPEAVIDSNVIAYTPNPASYVGGADAMTQTAMIDNPVLTDAVPTVSTDMVRDVMPSNVPPPPPESATNLAGSVYDIGKEGLKSIGIDTPFKALVAGNLGVSAVKAYQEGQEFKEEEARRRADLEDRRRRYREIAEGIMSRNPIRFAASGGMMDDIDDPRDEVGYRMAGGGMPPRFLSGGGDGMSDSIPAVIADKQPARLADGEFVIPADVVSHLGNGSSKAGAKQLYAMMDRIRKARTGTTKQGKEVKPRRFMPA